eukprot:symbB.v1.2.027353.t2/scaffold2799.1/size70062/2
MAFYQELRGLGPHGGLAVATAMSTAGEVVLTGWSERFGVHMGLNQITSYRDSFKIAREARGNALSGAWAGAGGLWVRNFSWNLTFFEWKRLLHNAVDKTPANAPQWFQTHLDWLRSLEKKNQANVLTFEAATLGTYLTFFNMAGDNIKTKMQVNPQRYPSFRSTAYEIWSQHGLLGFTRGSLFKGIYLILGSTLAIGIQERLTEIMAALLSRDGDTWALALGQVRPQQPRILPGMDPVTGVVWPGGKRPPGPIVKAGNLVRDITIPALKQALSKWGVAGIKEVLLADSRFGQVALFLFKEALSIQ